MQAPRAEHKHESVSSLHQCRESQKHLASTLFEGAHGHRTRKEVTWQRRCTRQWAWLRVTRMKGRKNRLIKQMSIMAWEGPAPLTWGPGASTKTASMLSETTDLTDTSVSSFSNKCDILFLKAPLCWNTPSLLLLWGQTCYLSSPSPVSYSPVLLVLRLPLPSPRAIIPCDLVTHTVSPRDQALSHRALVLKVCRAPFCYLLPK